METDDKKGEGHRPDGMRQPTQSDYDWSVTGDIFRTILRIMHDSGHRVQELASYHDLAIHDPAGRAFGPEHAERIRECLDILYWGHGFVSDLARFGREASRAPIRCATPLTVSECCQHTEGLRSYWTAIELAAEVRNLEVPATLCTVLLLLRISTGTLSRMVRLEGGLVDRHVTLRAVALDRPKDGTRNRYTMRTVIDHVETSDGMCILTLGPEASWSCSLPKRNACEIHPLDRR
jgi:hypothetical protein